MTIRLGYQNLRAREQDSWGLAVPRPPREGREERSVGGRDLRRK